jgi:hypothetical protein
MRRRLGVLAIAAMAVTLVAAGCGGDDDDGGEAPTKDEFITQADEICTDGDQQINEEAEEVFEGEPSKAEQQAFVEETVIPETQAQIDGIRDLTPPEGDEDQINAIVDAADQGIEEIEADPAALTQGGENPLAEAGRLASEYGMKACGQG